ncbi:MAG: hypothetical protein WD077_03440 [Bacteroidia bacterium]
MSDMSKPGGGMMMGNFPEKYNLKINTNHPLAKKFSEAGQVDAKGILLAALLPLNLLKEHRYGSVPSKSYYRKS